MSRIEIFKPVVFNNWSGVVYGLDELRSKKGLTSNPKKYAKFSEVAYSVLALLEV